MIRFQLPFPHLILIGASLVFGCSSDSGEEDSGLTDDALTTPCKASDAYLATAGGSHSAKTGELQKRSAPLSPTTEIPIGLSCVEWQTTDNQRLDVQIVNFAAGCEIDWAGGAGVEQETLRVRLKNPSCSVAACGNCLYDTHTSVALPESDRVELRLELSSCEGEAKVLAWDLSIGEKSHGYLCDFADAWGSRAAASRLGLEGTAFTPCDDPGEATDACNAGLTCQSSSAGLRCLPECSSDADCPLEGALTCASGYCTPADE